MCCIDPELVPGGIHREPVVVYDDFVPGMKHETITFLVPTPTLVITGQRDTRYNHDIAELLVKSIPNVQHVVIPNVGHLSNMEAPEKFNKAVLDYLTEIE